MAKKIIIIEDEERLLDLILFNLKGLYEIDGFGDAESFLKVYKPEETGVIITDVRLPGIDGVELLNIIKKLQIMRVGL